ncbi:MAG: biotin synthase BioB [Treponema sp.]|nr:biotin synthase BioB [Treponema sp.]
MKNIVQEVKEKIIDYDYKINFEEALSLYSFSDADQLFSAANEIRKTKCSGKTSVCSVINAKQGMCGEDCIYCAQSCRWKTSCKVTPLIAADEAVEKCKLALQCGVHRLSLVTAGRGLCGKDFLQILECFKEISKRCPGLKTCASLGIISYSQMLDLKACGVVRYHHNLETSRQFFPNVCKTHSWQERMDTLLAARKAGLELCCGGIIGLGESREDRVSLAFDLLSLKPESIPLNILSPIKGTPLENAKALCKEEILRTIAVFRFILPDSTLRIAAGRKSLGENGRDAFLCGANALISGDLLTIPGSTNEDDIAMLRELGFTPTYDV